MHDKVLAALVGLGFKRKPAESALVELRARGVEPEPEPLLRAALAALTAA